MAKLIQMAMGFIQIVAFVAHAHGAEDLPRLLNEGAREAPARLIDPTGKVDEVRHRYEAKLMRIRGVVGVGVGRCNGTDCIKVFVMEESQEILESVPKEIEGIEVDIEETGQFRTLPSP